MINMEARSIDCKSLTRRCAVAKLQDVTMPKYRDLMAQNAGALLVILPHDLEAMSPEERQHLEALEREIVAEQTTVPVYFALEGEYVNEIYEGVQGGVAGEDAVSAWEALVSSATANGFQLVVSGTAAEAMPDFEITNIQGHLSGYGIEEQLPTIVVTAHYDAMGMAPSLSYGADSNGSGVIILLELARLFSKLYTNSRTHAKYNLVFLLTGGGKFNYQGSKRWIEDNFENAESSMLGEVAMVVCLDSLGAGHSLNMHVSKPPRPGTPGDHFYQHLQAVASAVAPDSEVGMVHKKINLADEMLAWEHERYSIKRMLAFTMSHLATHKAAGRHSILDRRSGVSASTIARNAAVLGEALARHVYNLSSHGTTRLFTDQLTVSQPVVSAWLDYLTSAPRAAQLLRGDGELVTTLEHTLARHLKDVSRTPIRADKRDPEFLFYSGSEYVMNAYNVKPAVFDLFLALCIAGYLAAAYFGAMNFHLIYYALKRSVMPSSPKTKVH